MLVDQEKVRVERVRQEAGRMAGSLREFVRGSWDIAEPGSPLMDGYHIDAICDHLQACAQGQISKLLICVPPRHTKSTLVSVMFPAWMWTHTPTEKMLFGSYSLELARRDSTRTRRIVSTEWYKERWPVILSEDQATKSNFENTHLGRRQITSIGGPTTGLGGTTLVLDDPLNAKDAESAVLREATITWIREAFTTRMDPGRPIRVCVMQRLHQNDPAGYFSGEGDWDELILPLEYEGPRKTTSIGWTDPRTVAGQVLWSERFDNARGRKELATLKKTLGSVAAAGQLQQRPVPRGGGTFKAQWIGYWYDAALVGGVPDPVVVAKPDGTAFECRLKELPATDPLRVGSWDMAFRGQEKNDYVVGQVWARGVREDKANRYLLSQKRGNYDFVVSLAAVRQQTEEYGPGIVLIEAKANGDAVVAALKGEVQGLISVNPDGGKESRAAAVAPLFEAGNVWLPHPDMPGFDWVRDYVAEMTMFPRGSHDDQVDATTQALSRMRDRRVEEIDYGPSLAAARTKEGWTV